MSPVLRLTLKALLNVLLIWLFATQFGEYVEIKGGWPAYVILGSLFTLLNVFARPMLNIITLPLRLFLSIVTIIIVNALFLWIAVKIAAVMDPDLVTFQIKEGLAGWIFVSILLGVVNWLLKEFLHLAPKNAD